MFRQVPCGNRLGTAPRERTSIARDSNVATLQKAAEPLNAGNIDAAVETMFAETPFDHDPAPGQESWPGRVPYLLPDADQQHVKALVYQGLYEVSVQDVPDASIEDPDDAVGRITTTKPR